MTPNYSLFRSKTFWTLVFQFVFTGFSAITKSLDPSVVVLINAALLCIASYFHLQTGLSSSGKN